MDQKALYLLLNTINDQKMCALSLLVHSHNSHRPSLSGLPFLQVTPLLIYSCSATPAVTARTAALYRTENRSCGA
jgi:hypothetical protein